MRRGSPVDDARRRGPIADTWVHVNRLDRAYLDIFGEHPDVGQNMGQPAATRGRTRSRSRLDGKRPDLRLLPADHAPPVPAPSVASDFKSAGHRFESCRAHPCFLCHIIAVTAPPCARTFGQGHDRVFAMAARLGERDLEIIDFEREWWKYGGAKETAIRERFDLSTVEYYQRLNWIIDQPRAVDHDPLLVRRLKRTRRARQRRRSSRRLG
jgi:hypothetical protein